MTERFVEEVPGSASETAAAPKETIDFEMNEALAGRSAFYDVLASLFFRPLTDEQIESMALGSLASLGEAHGLMEEGLADMDRYLRRRNTGTRQELAIDFTAAFAGTSSWEGRYAVPYKSVFTSKEGLMFQEAFHEVRDTYRRQHVERAQGYDYPDDHLSFMCEFMALLSDRAREALAQGRRSEALETLRCSKTFLEQHILSWFEDFRDLSLKILKTRFYRGAMKTAEGFFAFDFESLGEMIEVLSESEIEREA